MRSFHPARVGVVVAGTALCLAAVRPVQAQTETRAFGLGSAAITYTDNLYNAANGAPPDSPQKESAWYLTLAPGAGLTHERRRSAYELTYLHPFFWYLTTVDAEAHGDQLAVTSEHALTPVDSLSFGLAGARSSTATMLTEPTAMGGPLPDPSATVYTGTASQGYSHEFSPNWRGTESATFGVARDAGTDLPEPWRFTLSGSLGAAYTLARDAWSLDWTSSYFHSRSAARNGERVPRARYLHSGPMATWRHDLSEEWSSLLTVGTGLSYYPDEEPETRLTPPTIGATLNWEHGWYTASLLYSASVEYDLLTNAVYYRDEAGVSGAWEMLPRQQVVFTTSHSVSANRPLVAPAAAASADNDATIYAWMSIAALTWSPERLPFFSLIYVHAAEFAADGLGPYPGSRTDWEFQRNQVTFSMGWQYPQVSLPRLTRRPPSRVTAPNSPDTSGGAGRETSQPTPSEPSKQGI